MLSYGTPYQCVLKCQVVTKFKLTSKIENSSKYLESDVFLFILLLHFFSKMNVKHYEIIKTSILQSGAGTQFGETQDTIEEQNLSCGWNRTLRMRNFLIL